MKLALREVGRVLGVPVESGAAVTGWSVDSRTVEPGDLFFALRGPNHDGNEYVETAFEKGAIAAVAPSALPSAFPSGGRKGAVLHVPDTQRALERLAAWAREHWAGDVVGVTGSAGKTSTKDVIARMLESELPVGGTTGNFNNQVGLPLSILRLPDDARVACSRSA